MSEDSPCFSLVSPELGFVKFNVDNSSNGNPGPTGCGEANDLTDNLAKAGVNRRNFFMSWWLGPFVLS
ncbi:hypothetical protein REPUB_Repub05bG0050800 [Reevesia pubescens]